MIQPFHLAIPVKNLELCRTFYRDIIQCIEGRSDTHWVDFNFFGHQLVIHQKDDFTPQQISNPVDGHDVPVPHFGVVLSMDDWKKLSERLKKNGTKFIIEPTIRFKGKPGEQATLFFKDPEGNALEFKAFKDVRQLFAT
ncbi:VOC family protein [Flavobacteriaceae bacterium]|jgi:extradiol dioxygenase family protein|nr:VOC family protein [Flavobacteriaceae bacterium]MDA9992981.1 VOC family protein [Flavobacteriaceae bacterium]MDB2337011.1 VOC family protein [Flavobacteriaceae bacterium]MDB2657654.1 VOC family protein [Flavobacteriaceae bacterium]MDB2674361.1 VOC family protein [Flavobacteriaceae bacterium]|tara:strand:+ start:11214 stop:11630 length:417 start_codon:yes stop_codon:yes gene_type:complete